MKNSENLKKKYEKYLIRGETPLREYEIGAYSVVTIDQRLLCIRKFPESFTQITYDSISNIEYHIYIDWRRFINSIILFAIASYGLFNPPLYNNIANSLLTLLNDNVPEISNLMSNISAELLTNIIIYLVILFGTLNFIRFILSLRGKLRISLWGSTPIRISTFLSENVKQLLKDVEEIKKRGKSVEDKTKGGEEKKELNLRLVTVTW